jgi:Flp pilus assembly protein TadD
MPAASARNLLRFAPPAALVLLLALVPGVALAVDVASARNSAELAERGIDTAARGDLAAAQRLLERAVAANPANARAYAHLGGVHQSMTDTRLARKYYGIALAIDPAEPDALNRIAQLDLAEGNRAAAEQRLRVLRFHCETCEQTRDLARVLSSGPGGP